MRIDKLLWFLRLARTRVIGQAMAEAGHMRLNGRRVERAHQQVAVGDRLVIPLGQIVKVITIVTLPERRGPASEARTCYHVLDDQREVSIATPDRAVAEEDLQP